ncbi:MAG: metalloregulator ArsR/SmtB family transcription factor [Ornithinimicrobium sp.]
MADDIMVAGNDPEGSTVQPHDTLADVFKALADPVRLRLYSAIATPATPTCVCDLPDVGVAQPTVSHHLRKLREAGLIVGERRGPWVYYRAVPEALGPVAEFTQAHSPGGAPL